MIIQATYEARDLNVFGPRETISPNMFNMTSRPPVERKRPWFEHVAVTKDTNVEYVHLHGAKHCHLTAA